jgi:hypothetical protein
MPAAAATPIHGEQAGPGPATPATGFHRLFLCFSFLGGGCGDPLLLLPGPLPCVLARPRGTDARGAGTDSGRTKAAHRGKPATADNRPPAKLTGAKDQRKPCGALFANVVETGGAGRCTGIATPEPTSNSGRRCAGQFGGRGPARRRGGGWFRAVRRRRGAPPAARAQGLAAGICRLLF